MVLGVNYWRLLFISLFALGIYSGSMSLERLVAFVSETESLPLPDLFQQIKLLALAPLLLFGLHQLRSPDARQHAFRQARSPIVLALIIFFVTILALEINRSQTLNSYAIAPYAILVGYMLLTPLVLKDEHCITLFFYLTILITACCLLITFAINNFSIYNFGDPAITTSFTLARLCSISVFLSLWLMHRNREQKGLSWFWLCATIIFVIFGTALGSRSFIAFLIPSALLVIAPVLAKQNFWLAARCLLAIFVGILIGLALTQAALNRLVFHNSHQERPAEINLLQQNNCQEDVDIFLQENNLNATHYHVQKACVPAITLRDNDGRLRLFEFAIQSADFLLGNGLDSFRLISRDAYYNQFNVYHHPHNILLGTFHSTGIIGLSILLVLLYITFIFTIRVVLEHRTENLLLLGIPVYILMASMTGGDFYDARWIFIFLFIAHLLPQNTAK